MSILAALSDYHSRLLDSGVENVPVYGFTTENISFALVISSDGEIVQIKDLRLDPKTPRKVNVPASNKRSGTIPKPFFLWDNTKHVLGLTADKASKDIVSSDKHRQAFRDLHRESLAGTDDAGLLALLAFLDRDLPECYQNDLESLRHVVDKNIVFMLQDDDRRFLHDRPAARTIWEGLVSARAGDTGMCLVTGRTCPVSRIHPSIKGVMDAQSSGASMVSFNAAAFGSYGREQGLNAPVSESVSAAYGAAINHLLRRGSSQRIQIGDASSIFWADASEVGEASAQASEFTLIQMLTPKAPDDESEAEKIRNKMILIAKGKAVVDVSPEVNPKTKCFLLGLSPSVSRLSVRFWQTGSFEQFSDNIRQHWEDLYIEPYPWKTGPAAWSLLRETAVLGKDKNIPPQLGGDLMRAILTGGRYPRTMLSAVIGRIRADGEISGRRAAIIKAILQRQVRKSVQTNEVPVSLNKEDQNPAYRLGRLFSVLESIQRQALGKINSPIRDKYFASASSSPASIFPVLIRGASAHLSSMRKNNGSGWAEMEIAEILDGINGVFPRMLSLEDQGRFSIGYYHQIQENIRRSQESAKKKKAAMAHAGANSKTSEVGE